MISLICLYVNLAARYCFGCFSFCPISVCLYTLSAIRVSDIRVSVIPFVFVVVVISIAARLHPKASFVSTLYGHIQYIPVVAAARALPPCPQMNNQAQQPVKPRARVSGSKTYAKNNETKMKKIKLKKKWSMTYFYCPCKVHFQNIPSALLRKKMTILTSASTGNWLRVPLTAPRFLRPPSHVR